MRTTHTLTAALGLLLLAPQGALADLSFPGDIGASYERYDGPRNNTVALTFRNNGGGTYATVGVNWCRAKDSLPSGWDTQDDRSLRTDSMCKANPKHGSLGKDFLGNEASWTGVKNFKIDHLMPGRWIISINFWAGSIVHHADGNHTSLKLVELEKPDICDDPEKGPQTPWCWFTFKEWTASDMGGEAYW